MPEVAAQFPLEMGRQARVPETFDGLLAEAERDLAGG